MLIVHTDTRTHRHTHKSTAENMIFWIKETSKRVNPSKFPFRKFDPKAILSLLMGKRK